MASKPKRRRPAVFAEHSVTDAIVVGAVRLGHDLDTLIDAFFEPYGITVLQFNALRILYVHDPEFTGIPSGAVGARLLARVPDVPRLIDRLVKSGLVERNPSPDDRRVVLVRLTQKGVDLMEETFPLLVEHNRRLLAPFTKSQLTEIGATLDRLSAVVAARRAAGPADD